MNYKNIDFTPEGVKEFRKSLGLSQAEFAEKMGISQPMVSKAENNPDDLTVSYLVRMQQAFDIVSGSKRKVGFFRRIWLRIKWILGLHGAMDRPRHYEGLGYFRPATFEAYVDAYEKGYIE